MPRPKECVGPFGPRVKLPSDHLSTKYDKGFTLSIGVERQAGKL